MTPRNEWLPVSGRTSNLLRRTPLSFPLRVTLLESREAAGALLNPLLPDPFLGLNDLPQATGFATPTEAISPPVERRLTRDDAWLPAQLPIEAEQSEVVIRSLNPASESSVSRFELSDDSFGVVLRSVSPLAIRAVAASNPVSVGSRMAFFEPSATTDLNVGVPRPVSTPEPVLPGSKVVVNSVTVDEPIPNEAPVAVNDVVTVAEDSSVVFDPTTNDTDPDTADKLWVKSVQSETDYGRTYWEDGGLIRYIPNPNYQNTSGSGSQSKDTFTYTVTDGVAEATATVTATVTSVNDGPAAANDVGVFTNPALQYPQAYPGPELTYTPSGNRSVFVNDRDYDSVVGLSVGPTKMSDEKGVATVGTVTVHPDGTFLWSGPKTFSGASAFQYQAKDNEGGLSDWVTVKLLVNAPGATDGPVDAVADLLAVGDGPDQGNVMTGAGGQDTGSFVVLDSQPNGGRLAGFGFDGAVKYLSDFTRAETSFTYTVFSTNGLAKDAAVVQTTAVNLTAWHGQYKAPAGANPGSKPVPELSEYAPFGAGSSALGGTTILPIFKPYGAFTVANLNDSDADNTQDSIDNDVPVRAGAAYAGSGELDLMKLVLSKPALVPGQNNVTLTVTSSSTPGVVPAVMLWKVPTKGNQPVPFDAQGKVAIPVDNAFPNELWLEFGGVSINAADVTIKMEYNGASDSVSATGIWTQNAPTVSGWPDGYFMNAGAALPADVDATGIKTLFAQNGAMFGEVNNKATGLNVIINGVPVPRMVTTNLELSKFTTMPTGLTPLVALGIVSVDVTRTTEVQAAIISPTFAKNPVVVTNLRPLWLDVANDETPQASSDNDNDLWGNGSPTDNLYSIDGPGLPRWYSTAAGVKTFDPNPANEYIVADFVARQNFFDFVRIKTGSQTWTAGPSAGVQGSRSSVFFTWHSLTHLRTTPPAGGVGWTTNRFNDPVTPAGKTENEIAPGLIDVTVIGG